MLKKSTLEDWTPETKLMNSTMSLSSEIVAGRKSMYDVVTYVIWTKETIPVRNQFRYMSDGIRPAEATLRKDTEYVTLTWASGMPIENVVTFSNGGEGPRNPESTYTLTKNRDQTLQKELQTG